MQVEHCSRHLAAYNAAALELLRKRASIACHRSQITDSSFFLQMPPEVFAMAFGTEWFIEPGEPGGARPGWFL